jgi:hypothetical protein
MNNSFRSIVLAASAVLAFANLGQASSIGYLRDAPGGDGPFLDGTMVVGAGVINSWSGRAGALSFELGVNGANGNYFDLITYCGDPFRTLSVGPVGGEGYPFDIITMQGFGYAGGDIIAIEKLWAMAFNDSLTSATKAAAFQFVLWELIADTNVDFTSGVVRISNNAVRSQAEAWSGQLANATDRAILLVLDGRAANRQSFFFEQTATTLIENPEPGTYFLIGAGLLAVGYLRRKR